MTAPETSTTGLTARRFHDATKHSYTSVRSLTRRLDLVHRPAPFKEYPGLAMRRLRSAGPADHPLPDTLSAQHLARLLCSTAGVVRHKPLPNGETLYARGYPSAGARYPVETYLVCGRLGGLEPGIYHFHPLHGALVRLLEGDHRGTVSQAVAHAPSAASAPAMLIFTGVPWRTTWKYGDRGYRHLFWDTGTLTANVLAMSEALELPAQVFTGFADDLLHELLGLDNDEIPLCLVTVGAGAPVPPPQPSAAPSSADGSPSRTMSASLRDVHDAGKLEPDKIVQWRAGTESDASPHDGPDGTRPCPLPGCGDPAELEALLRERGSARTFAPGALPAGGLRTVLHHAMSPVPVDHPVSQPLVRPYLTVHEAAGLPRGAYAFDAGVYRLLREGMFREEATYLSREQRRAGDAAVTAYLMVDLDLMTRSLGDRGYRVAHLHAGIAAGRLYLGAHAAGWGATALTFYDDEVTDFFAPHADGTSCLLVVAMGPRAHRRSEATAPERAAG